MKQCIFDASVGVKLIFGEEFSKEARDLQQKISSGQIQGIVPEMFYVEVSNACMKRNRSKLCSFEQAMDGLSWMYELPFTRYSDSELADIALENAGYYGISVYDALYVSLAEVYVAPLITADEKLLERCARKNFPFIESLSEFITSLNPA